MHRILAVACCIAVLALVPACRSGGTKRVDPDEDDKLGGTGMDSADVRTIADWMARSLVDKTAGRVPDGSTVAILEVRNETRFFIDTLGVARRLETQVMNSAPDRFVFLGRERIQDVLKEREFNQANAAELGKLLGAKYFLAGEIHGISKARRSDRSDYVETTFQLIDASTSAKVWQDSHEFKKVSKAGTVYR